MPPQTLGGVQNLITDSFGKYHNLAQGAFDALSNTNVGKRPANFFDLIQRPMKESGKKLLDSVGFDTSKILAPIVKDITAAKSGIGGVRIVDLDQSPGDARLSAVWPLLREKLATTC